jgi:hypothetical protein
MDPTTRAQIYRIGYAIPTLAHNVHVIPYEFTEEQRRDLETSDEYRELPDLNIISIVPHIRHGDVVEIYSDGLRNKTSMMPLSPSTFRLLPRSLPVIGMTSRRLGGGPSTVIVLPTSSGQVFLHRTSIEPDITDNDGNTLIA